jgi:hypothetical protein
MFVIELEIAPNTLASALPPKALLDTDAAATLLGVTRDALVQARYRHRGMPAVVLSRRRVRYRVQEVTRVLAERGE